MVTRQFVTDTKEARREMAGLATSMRGAILPALGLTFALTAVTGGMPGLTSAALQASSSMWRIQTSLYDLQSALLKALLPALDKVAPALASLFDSLGRTIEGEGSLAETLGWIGAAAALAAPKLIQWGRAAASVVASLAALAAGIKGVKALGGLAALGAAGAAGIAATGMAAGAGVMAGIGGAVGIHYGTQALSRVYKEALHRPDRMPEDYRAIYGTKRLDGERPVIAYEHQPTGEFSQPRDDTMLRRLQWLGTAGYGGRGFEHRPIEPILGGGAIPITSSGTPQPTSNVTINVTAHDAGEVVRQIQYALDTHQLRIP